MDGQCARCGPSSSPADPRKQDVCVRCGRMLTPRVTETHRQGEPPAMPRDVAWERRFTTEAARAVGVDPGAFIAFSEARILPGPIRRGYVRDMLQEVREECSDARNYMCWRAQQCMASGDASELPAIGDLLARLLLLWHDLDTLDATTDATDAG